MKILSKKLQIETKKQFEIVDITYEVISAVQEAGIKDGLAVVFCPHSTAAIRINNNEPLLLQDILKMLYRLVPVDINYAHDIFEMRQNISISERSNGHAHVKSFLLGSSESIPVVGSELTLGQNQSIFFVELDGARKREYQVQIVGQ